MMNDDWIEYNGGLRPCEAKRLVDAKLANGRVFSAVTADMVVWGNMPRHHWRVVAYRLINEQSAVVEQPAPKHYDNYYSRPLTDEERTTGIVKLKLDPYRIADVLNIGGGAREQIMKKALRWTTKGDSERKVIKEIMQACERRLEMLDEDGL